MARTNIRNMKLAVEKLANQVEALREKADQNERHTSGDRKMTWRLAEAEINEARQRLDSALRILMEG